MRRTQRSGPETWLDEAARRGGEAVRRHERLRRQPPSFDGGPFIGTKHTLHRPLVGRDSRLSRPASGRDRPCHGRNPTTVHNHRLTSPCRKTERKRTETREVHNKTRNSFGILSQSCKMEREREDTCHQQRSRLQRKVYIRNRERRRDEREKGQRSTKRTVKQGARRSGGRHLSPTKKETTEEGIHP